MSDQSTCHVRTSREFAACVVASRAGAAALLGLVVSALSSGCTALTMPINGVPARRLPPQFFATPRSNAVPVDVSRLSQQPPRQYLLDKGDILGIYIEGVLPFNAPDEPPSPPPVNYPTAESLLPPSIGYPTPVQEDGSIFLPLIEPVQVRGLTVDQAREKIKQAYTTARILAEGRAQPVVSVIRERTYNVLVVRQDTGASSSIGGASATIRQSDEAATGGLVKLPAYQNDVLHALMLTGGLPGFNAQNEIQVLRSSQADQRKRDEFIRAFYEAQAPYKDPCLCPPKLPDDPTIVRIPLRLPPGVVPAIRPQDIILEDGDIVFIENRDTEVYYTGGLLPGGEFPLPRDYDLDVIGAIALAGGSVGGMQQGGGGGGMGGRGMMGAQSLGGVPPGMLYVLRRTPCDGQVTIEVDLARAINDPRDRPLVQPGDILILQYKPNEEILNFGLATFFTYGIFQLLGNGGQGGGGGRGR
jgi:protein involved in polysaccharide export with SLBB domain